MFFPFADAVTLKSLKFVLAYLLVWCFLSPILLRYIDNETGRVMHDIVTKDSYGRQFEAIQHCFRIIGFTDEVRDTVSKPLSTFFLKTSLALPVFRLPFDCVNTQLCHRISLMTEMNYESKTHTPRSRDQPEVSFCNQASPFTVLYHTCLRQ